MGRRNIFLYLILGVTMAFAQSPDPPFVEKWTAKDEDGVLYIRGEIMVPKGKIVDLVIDDISFAPDTLLLDLVFEDDKSKKSDYRVKVVYRDESNIWRARVKVNRAGGKVVKIEVER